MLIEDVKIPDFSGRILVGDTETTGFSYKEGDKLIEIAFIEIINKQRTGRKYHVFVDPGCEVSEGAVGIHGWDRESLIEESGGKRFNHVAKELEEFVSGSMVVFHNSPFDVGFLDHEMKLAECQPLSEISTVYDTLKMARKLYPGKRNTLDALCKRLDIDASSRDLHGALIDSDILIDVFLSLSSTQENLSTMFSDDDAASGAVYYADLSKIIDFETEVFDLPVIKASMSELADHEKFVSDKLS